MQTYLIIIGVVFLLAGVWRSIRGIVLLAWRASKHTVISTKWQPWLRRMAKILGVWDIPLVSEKLIPTMEFAFSAVLFALASVMFSLAALFAN